MRRVALAAALTLLVALDAVRAEEWAETSDRAVTFRGDYVWVVENSKTGGTRDRVEAVFTPTGGDLWDVAFHFRFAGKDDTYRGKAQGTLDRGTIRGDVEGSGGVQRFAFEATVDGDRLDGEHFDIWKNRRDFTGTLSLERMLPERAR